MMDQTVHQAPHQTLITSYLGMVGMSFSKARFPNLAPAQLATQMVNVIQYGVETKVKKNARASPSSSR